MPHPNQTIYRVSFYDLWFCILDESASVREGRRLEEQSGSGTDHVRADAASTDQETAATRRGS